MIGTEGKIDVTSGTVTNAVSAENQINSNTGTLATWIGTNNHIVTNSASIPLVIGSNLQIDGNTSTITTAAAVVVSNPTSNSGTIGSLIGLYIPNITASGVTSKYSILSQDTAATLYQAGPSVLVGNVGVGTASPQATLDVNGTFRLAANNSAPAPCQASIDGNLARTSRYTLCICKGGSSTWVSTNDGTTGCVW